MNTIIKTKSKVIFSSLLFIILVSTTTSTAGRGKNHFGFFFGSTSNFETKRNYVTLGADYEYKLSNLFSVGLASELVFADHLETIGLGTIIIKPVSNFKLLVGNGLEMSDGHSNYLLRLGAGYDFHAGAISITPTLNLDRVKGHSLLVYGLTIGFGL